MGVAGKRLGRKIQKSSLAMSCLTCLRDPKGRCQVAGRIRGSEFKGAVKAAGTNLEVISLRIFKSMGTGEITQGEGWRDRKKPWSNPRGTLKTVSPRGPGTPWVYQAHGPLGPEQRPAPDKFMTSLPFRGLQGSGIEAGGKEGEGSQ